MKKNSKLILKACPRCSGDLFPNEYEEDLVCLQCGRSISVAQILAQRPALAPVLAEAA